MAHTPSEWMGYWHTPGCHCWQTAQLTSPLALLMLLAADLGSTGWLGCVVGELEIAVILSAFFQCHTSYTWPHLVELSFVLQWNCWRDPWGFLSTPHSCTTLLFVILTMINPHAYFRGRQTPYPFSHSGMRQSKLKDSSPCCRFLWTLCLPCVFPPALLFFLPLSLLFLPHTLPYLHVCARMHKDPFSCMAEDPSTHGIL